MLKESFIPVVLMFTLLVLVLFSAKLMTTLESHQSIVIEISPAQELQVSGTDSEEVLSGEMELVFAETPSHPLIIEADKLMASGKMSEAEALYLKVSKEEPQSTVFNRLGFLYFKQGKQDLALKALDRALSFAKSNASAYFNRAVVFSSLKDSDKALLDYQKMLEFNPFHYESLYNVGLIYLAKSSYQLAEDYFQRAATGAGGDRKAKALYNLGYTLKKAGNKVQQARDAFNQSIRIKPGYIKPRYHLALLEPDTTAGTEAKIKQLKQVLDLQPNFSSAYYRLGLIKIEQERFSEATLLLKKAIQYNPGHANARYRLGELYMDKGKWKKAKSQFSSIVQADPQHSRAQFLLGRAAFGSKEYDSAIEAYQKVIDLKSGNYPEAHLNMGLVYSKTKLYEKARHAYENAIKWRPEYADAWYNLGLVELKNKNPSKAMLLFDKATQFNPEFASAWFNKGVIYSRQKKYDEAIKAYLKAILHKPNYNRAKLNLAVRYAKKKKYHKAITLYKEVLGSDPSYASAWINLGMAYGKTNQAIMAGNAFRKAIQLDRGDPKAKRLLAKLLIRNNETESGLLLMLELVDQFPEDVKQRLRYAKALFSIGKVKMAVIELEKAHRLAPENQLVEKTLNRFKAEL